MCLPGPARETFPLCPGTRGLYVTPDSAKWRGRGSVGFESHGENQHGFSLLIQAQFFLDHYQQRRSKLAGYEFIFPNLKVQRIQFGQTSYRSSYRASNHQPPLQ